MHDFFREDYERIMMAYRLSATISRDEKDIRACGNEVEIVVRDFFKEKLAPKYHVSDGHIIDNDLNVSQQIDIIISDAMKNPVFNRHSDGSELVFYDSVYAFGEVKRSYYNPNILKDFSDNIERIHSILKRQKIASNILECANDFLAVKQPLVDNIQRNMLLAFLFIVDTQDLNIDKMLNELASIDNSKLPNMIVVLNAGIFLNIERSDSSTISHPVINLYPPKTKDNNEWHLLTFDNPTGVLSYAHLLVQEHLRTTLVAAPDFMRYTDYIFKTYNSQLI